MSWQSLHWMLPPKLGWCAMVFSLAMGSAANLAAQSTHGPNQEGVGALSVLGVDQSASPLEDLRPISLNFQNVEIVTLLQVFAEFTGLNLIATDSVKGQVTVRLTDVPWPQALQIVLRSKGLAWLRVKTDVCCGWLHSANGRCEKKCSGKLRPLLRRLARCKC